MQTIIAFIEPPDGQHRYGDASQRLRGHLEKEIFRPEGDELLRGLFASIVASLCPVGDINVGRGTLVVAPQPSARESASSNSRMTMMGQSSVRCRLAGDGTQPVTRRCLKIFRQIRPHFFVAAREAFVVD